MLIAVCLRIAQPLFCHRAETIRPARARGPKRVQKASGMHPTCKTAPFLQATQSTHLHLTCLCHWTYVAERWCPSGFWTPSIASGDCIQDCIRTGSKQLLNTETAEKCLSFSCSFLFPVREGLPVPRSRRCRQAEPGMAERGRHRESGGQDARSERPAMGHGQHRAPPNAAGAPVPGGPRSHAR